ncbi:hypothetical protein GCM10029978_072270 [Actinoallomurus acanthiterrae]
MIRILEAAELPNLTMQVIPFDAGAHPGMLGSFVLLRFGQEDLPDVVYVDSMAGDLFLDQAADVERCASTFEHLRAVALSPEASAEFVAKLTERT